MTNGTIKDCETFLTWYTAFPNRGGTFDQKLSLVPACHAGDDEATQS